MDHSGGQIGGKDWETDEQDETHQVGEDERYDPIEDRRDLDVLDHTLDHEHVHTDRRMNEAELDRHYDDDAKPDRIEPELFDHRENDWNGQDDHGERVHEAAQYQVHQHDQNQHPVATHAESGQKRRHLLRRLRDREEITEQQGADEYRKHRCSRAGRLQQRLANVGARQAAAQHP